MNQNQAKKKAIFLDRDGVINTERGVYTWKISDFAFVDGIVESLQAFQDQGYLLVVISNQGGIAKGLYTVKDVQHFHVYLTDELLKHEIQLTDIYFCPHHSSVEKCICRKPESLLFEKAIAKYHINPAESYMFGDKTTDIEAAEKCGIKGIFIEANENIIPHSQQILSKTS